MIGLIPVVLAGLVAQASPPPSQAQPAAPPGQRAPPMAPLLAPAQPPVPANERPSPIPPLAATAPRPPPEPPEGLSPERLEKIQAALRDEKLDGWLFYDFRGSDSIATRVLGLSTRGPRTRRWYCYVPARGTPQKLVHAIEPHSLDGVPGQVSTYASWRVRDRELGRILRGARRIAMQYSPRNEIPTVAKVDAGTLELVRAMGPEVVSSAGLVARIESVLTPEELATQARAAQIIAGVQEETAREAARRVREGHPATERELQEFASARMQAEGLVDGGPLIAVDEHAADPHSTATDGVAGHNSLLLLDFTGRVDAGPHAIQGDLTRVYFLGERIPDEIARVAQVVFEARDAALDLLRKRLEAHRPVTGAEVDEAARSVVARAGYADAFLHRTGHSIGLRAHGDGVNNDDFETRDTRKHLESTCFSIEPGIYLAHRFGIRSEVDACILQGGKLEVRGGEPQHEVPAMLAPEMPASLERSTHGP